MKKLTVYPHAERPELQEQKWNSRTNWPEFIFHAEGPEDITAQLLAKFPQFQLYYCESEDQLAAYSIAIPIPWTGHDEDLPEGWTSALELGLTEGTQNPTTLCALGVDIRPDCQGQGYSREILLAMKHIADYYGFSFLIAPVRPTFKDRYPLTTIEDYIAWKREDGQPFDPWIRVHCKIGGRIARAAPKSMSVRGTVNNWEKWTDMSFPTSGEYVVLGALALVSIDRENNVGYHEEPNVWIIHDV